MAGKKYYVVKRQNLVSRARGKAPVVVSTHSSRARAMGAQHFAVHKGGRAGLGGAWTKSVVSQQRLNKMQARASARTGGKGHGGGHAHRDRRGRFA